MNLAAAFRKEMIEQWRTSRLLVLVLVMVFFGMLSPLFAKYTPLLLGMIPGASQYANLIPPPTILDAVAQYIKNAGQFGVILALLLTMGAVANEKEKGSAALMLVKPLPRLSFLLAKFLAIACSFVIAYAIAGVGAYYYTLVLFGPLDAGGWLALNGFMVLDKLVYIAVMLLFSTLFKSQAAAAGAGVGVLVVFTLLNGLPGIGEWMPNQMIAWGGSLLTGLALTAWPALALGLGLIVVSLIAAWLVFERQEL
jgi:ABC-2 type transport system permease protein